MEQHDGSVVGTVSSSKNITYAPCCFSVLCEFSLGTLVSSHTTKTCIWGIGELLGVNVRVKGGLFLYVTSGDLSKGHPSFCLKPPKRGSLPAQRSCKGKAVKWRMDVNTNVLGCNITKSWSCCSNNHVIQACMLLNKQPFSQPQDAFLLVWIRNDCL